MLCQKFTFRQLPVMASTPSSITKGNSSSVQKYKKICKEWPECLKKMMYDL